MFGAAPDEVVARCNVKCVGVGGLDHSLHGVTDHRPVVCTMEVGAVVKARKPPPAKFNLKRVSWSVLTVFKIKE